jgi:DNA invertase Pin-like site-specific DNA recombinase
MWQLPPLTPEEILLYLRKSQSDDPLLTVEETLARHEQRLDEWVERNLPGAGRVPESNRIREVVSGETIDGRPGMLDLLRRVESPRVKAILVVEPQRLSRGSLKDIGRLVELLQYSNTIVITMQYTYDLRDERDRKSFERELMSGNEYLEYYKRIQRNGRIQSVQNGNYLGTWAPYGYKKIQYKEGKNTCYTLEPIPEEARIVKQIFEWYRDGLGSHTIARKLNEMGVKSKNGGRWRAESLKKMRTNEHYIGKVVWNKRQEVKTVEKGEVVISRPVSHDYLVFPGKQPAIIDQELWDAVQEIRDKIPPVKDKAKCVNPFAGLVTCRCGYIMTKRVYKRRDGTERNPPRLLCTNQAEADCKTASCLVSEMTDAVVGVLTEAIEDFDLQIKNNNSDVAERHRQLIAQHEKRLEELNKLELSQWDKYTKEEMPKHIFDQLNERVLQEKADVQQALCIARETLPEPVDYEKKKAMFSEALELLKDPDAPALEQNMLLKKCIDHIEYYREKKKGGNRRWGDPEPMQLDVHLRV